MKLLLLLMIWGLASAQVTPLENTPLASRVRLSAPQPYDDTLRCQTITWGPDYVPWLAQEQGEFAAAGLKTEHVNEDVITEQLSNYLSDAVCLRGTVEQVTQVADALASANLSEYAPVVALLHSFSAGGDVIVGSAEVQQVTDLCDATVAAQRDGPSLALLVTAVSEACAGGVGELDILWTEDLIGFGGSSPGEALRSGAADAALVITPDALALTGEGEAALPGASILIGTGSATRAVADVLAFRKDFIQAEPDAARAYVETVLSLQEQVKNGSEALFSIGAERVLDLPGNLEEAELLWLDAEKAGFSGNVEFFTQPSNPVGFAQLAERAKTNLRELNLLSGDFELEQANWDYASFSPELLALPGTTLPSIDPNQAKTAVEDGERLFCFAVLFDPTQTEFPVERYAGEFDKAIRQAATFPNVLFTLEGNMAVNRYVRQYREGASQAVLTGIQQQATRDSKARAVAVLAGINSRASDIGVSQFNPEQFVIIGNGIEKPRRGLDSDGIPVAAATEDEWNKDRNVSVCVTNIQVEDDVFVPLD